MVNDWIMPVLVGGGMFFQVALAIDRWVHKQGYDGVELAKEIDVLAKEIDVVKKDIDGVKHDVAGLRLVFDAGNGVLSRKMGEVNTRIVNLELDVARLKALDEAAHRHHREGDYV